jgi:hypothetical protein
MNSAQNNYVVRYLLEAMESGALCVYIVLVDLVGKDEELLLGRKPNDTLHIVPGQDLQATEPGKNI